jgi:hypothetical protein
MIFFFVSGSVGSIICLLLCIEGINWLGDWASQPARPKPDRNALKAAERAERIAIKIAHYERCLQRGVPCRKPKELA